jgi:transposase
MTVQAKKDIARKLRVLNHGMQNGNISKTCRYFGISRETFYKWKRTYERMGEQGLIDSKPCPENPKIRVPKHIEDKILYLRRTYHFYQQRIAWYLQRYHTNHIIKTSPVPQRVVIFCRLVLFPLSERKNPALTL